MSFRRGLTVSNGDMTGGSDSDRTAVLPGPTNGASKRSPALDLRDLNPPDSSRYRLGDEHARGGLGRVITARDVRLDRPVAIKELIHCNDQAEARFIREALITARLQHPAIVPVHDLGRNPAGQPFYAMKMVSGRSLAELLSEKKTLVERLALLPNVIAVADAVAYAHGQRVIHRDLKPSNVLIGSFGETVVIDWGLAADLDEAQQPNSSVLGAYEIAASQLTVAGTILGTPEYMPAEQAKGQPVDQRADVYAIGAILYHLLAGAPPYRGKSSREVISQVTRQEPTPVERLQSGTPAELATIVHKAMARDPSHRYPTAKELAEDLRRFQTGQLVSAHSYTRITLLRRWVERHRAPVLVGAVFLVLCLVGGFVAVRRIIGERNIAEARRDELLLVQARTALDRDPTAAVAWLKTYASVAKDPSRTHDLALEASALGVARHVFRRSYTKPSAPAFSADGSLFASSGENGTVRVYDLKTGHSVATLPYAGEVRAIEFSPSGSLLAWSDWESSKIILWDFKTGTTRELIGHTGIIYRIRFSPTGEHIASIAEDRTVRLWSVESDKSRVLYTETDKTQILEFTRDGRYIVSLSDGNTISIWDTNANARRMIKIDGTGLRLALSRDPQLLAYSNFQGEIGIIYLPDARLIDSHHEAGRPVHLSFSSDERMLAAADSNGIIRLVDLKDRSNRSLIGHQGQVSGVGFSSNGRFLASTGQDGTIRVWDLQTGQHHAIRGHQGAVYGPMFSPDGKYFATFGGDKTTRVWELSAVTKFSRVLNGHTDQVQHIAFSPDGERLASGSRDGTTRIWNIATGQQMNKYDDRNLVFRVRFSPDGHFLASAGFAKNLHLWKLDTDISSSLVGHDGIVWDVQFAHSGNLIATAGADGTVRLWNRESTEGYVLGRHLAEVRSIVFSPDDHLIASGGSDNLVHVWDISNSRRRDFKGHTGVVYTLSFSPAGRFLASGSFDGTIRVWDLRSGDVRVFQGHLGRIRSVAFSPDGKTLASGAEDHLVRLWDVATGQSRVLSGHRNEVEQVVFSPDGALLASTCWDNTVRIWDVNTGQLRHINHHSDRVVTAAFSPDGAYVASSGTDGIIKLLPLTSRTAIAPSPTGLIDSLGGLTTATLGPDEVIATP